jgi:hypothetical protein
MIIEIKELINIEEVLKELEKLPDHRRIEEKIEHNQRDILFGVLCSMFADNKAMTEMHNWIEINFNTHKFKRLIGRENEELDIPSYPTMRRMIINLNPSKMEEMFRRYFIPRAKIEEDSQIAVDGKMMNGSGRKGQYKTKRNDGMLKMKFSDKPFLFVI